VIVYLDNPRLTPLSAIVKSSGVYTIPLSGARLRDLKTKWGGPIPDESFDLLVQGGSLGQATAVVNMKNRDRVPDIAIPGNYDFSVEFPRDGTGAIILPAISPGSTLLLTPTLIPASKFSFSNLPTPTESEEITILYPA